MEYSPARRCSSIRRQSRTPFRFNLNAKTNELSVLWTIERGWLHICFRSKPNKSDISSSTSTSASGDRKRSYQIGWERNPASKCAAQKHLERSGNTELHTRRYILCVFSVSSPEQNSIRERRRERLPAGRQVFFSRFRVGEIFAQTCDIECGEVNDRSWQRVKQSVSEC